MKVGGGERRRKERRQEAADPVLVLSKVYNKPLLMSDRVGDKKCHQLKGNNKSRLQIPPRLDYFSTSLELCSQVRSHKQVKSYRPALEANQQNKTVQGQRKQSATIKGFLRSNQLE